MFGNLEETIKKSKDDVDKRIKNYQRSAMIEQWIERYFTAILIMIQMTSQICQCNKSLMNCLSIF